MPDTIRIKVADNCVEVPAGISAAAALRYVGAMHRFRPSVTGETRAPLCGMGICFGCQADVAGEANRLTCQLPCTDGVDFSAQGEPKTEESKRLSFDVLIVGAGPAGLAAAAAAAPSGRHIGIIDDNPAPGGQIWRSDFRKGLALQTSALLDQAASENTTLLSGTRIIAALGPKRLLAESGAGVLELQFDKLVLATGARERFLPFPGWTLPGVMGAGGLQALVKCGWPIQSKRVVVAGSGPLLLAVAAYLKKAGAIVMLIAEQAPASKVNAFARSLLVRSPGKLLQGMGLRFSLLGVPYRCGSWPRAALGTARLEAVRLIDEAGRTNDLPCDYLACGFGLVPNTELAQHLGCAMADGVVSVDDCQKTCVPGIFAAGELTGIGGLDKSKIEGAIAGLAAAGNAERARALSTRRWKTLEFAARLEETFALRHELKTLAGPDTLICRCEDVPFAAVGKHASWRTAKLQTRCGMGPCQGRVCGPITEFLFGWPTTSVRPPIFPARLATLCSLAPEDRFL